MQSCYSLELSLYPAGGPICVWHLITMDCILKYFMNQFFQFFNNLQISHKIETESYFIHPYLEIIAAANPGQTDTHTHSRLKTDADTQREIKTNVIHRWK